MARYLEPKNARWHKDRNIPERLGLAMTGPPGNGKSSLITALAGHYSLDVYKLNLDSTTMTDEDLEPFFDALPYRCILAIEDFVNLDEIPYQPPLVPSRLSRSALLNAIDGIGAAEGRVLILTTNYPKNLDQALTRPGRIDVTYDFNNPAESEIQNTFILIYEPHRLANPSDIVQDQARDFARLLRNSGLSTARVKEFCMANPEDPQGALKYAKEHAFPSDRLDRPISDERATGH